MNLSSAAESSEPNEGPVISPPSEEPETSPHLDLQSQQSNLSFEFLNPETLADLINKKKLTKAPTTTQNSTVPESLRLLNESSRYLLSSFAARLSVTRRL